MIRFKINYYKKCHIAVTCDRVILLSNIQDISYLLEYGFLLLLIVCDIRKYHRLQVCDVVDFGSQMQSFQNILLYSWFFFFFGNLKATCFSATYMYM